MTSTFGTHDGVESTVELLKAEIPQLEQQQHLLERELAEINGRLEAGRAALTGLQSLSAVPLLPQQATESPEIAPASTGTARRRRTKAVPTVTATQVVVEPVVTAQAPVETVETVVAEPVAGAQATEESEAARPAATGRKTVAKSGRPATRSARSTRPAKSAGTAKKAAAKKAAEKPAETLAAQPVEAAAEQAVEKSTAAKTAAKRTPAKRIAVQRTATKRTPAKRAAKAVDAPKADVSDASDTSDAQVSVPAQTKRTPGLTNDILAYLATTEGPVRAAEVAAGVGREATAGSINAVRTALERLANSARAQRTGRGLYQALSS